MDSYDAVVVGASVGGCTAARMLASAGARVALLERSPDPDHYKTVCTHYIQPSATPTIERLGLAPLIEERGAVHNSIEVWSPYTGWIRPFGEAPYGYNITRRTLDPILRKLAADTPGVDYMPGQTVVGLRGNGRVSGVEMEDSSRGRRSLDARLVVAADGRDSRMAELAGVPGRVRPHRRFFYWAYWSGLEPGNTRSRMWFMEPDCAYTFPNEDGLTLVLVGPHEHRLPEFRADLEGAYSRYIAALPDGPDLSGATRESKLLGKLKLPNVMRPAAARGMAFVGDAALASDPLWGVGCGWAFQSAEWLADCVGPSLASGADLDSGLQSYRKLHRRRLGPHHFLIADLSTARKANPFERRMYQAAARDPVAFAAFEAVGARRRSPLTMFSPRVLAHVLRPQKVR
ncbi:MAG TPA: NAD(P)/FAD-dependent oxidoreductase [Thermoleophilaceae bacterium]|nr:NAD(P)/FAD-dependent oxidoreductase [Thermoleophilaceae bacterium]